MFITQRVFQLSPTIRDQCSTLYLFQCSVKDADILADEFGFELIRKAPSLPQYHFIHATRFGKCHVCTLKQ